MKNLFTIFAISMLAFTSCTKKEATQIQVNTKDSVATGKSFAVDSIKISDSIKKSANITLAYENSILVFPGIEDKSLFDSIYNPTGLKAKDFSQDALKLTLEQDRTDFYKGFDNADYEPSSRQTWDNTSNMTVFSNQSDVLTLRYTTSGYTGGAHGFYNEIYKVFDLKNKKSINLEDVVKNPKDKAWEKLLMDSFIKNDKDDQKAMLLEKTIPLNHNFYFGNNSITFVYNQYEITAYAAGLVYISLQYDDIKDYLKPEFLQRIAH
ncbi:DUF3298 and DUF4163 domain-containing protein [Chryseobacterium sp. POL2]|uniref:DUF3298 and DUF4163 domain-containing protein n=1 Tax=Chryseobacterium sp. POL2 TaxID=2713414 RepID=UPI0013E1A4A2|nr:DUF3298 and DUF4163 domain-containing protein [Chryseobacterium sp. POL2]QIG90841.1 DUF3298 and DUF4163 domain-containing protein [Chryseobacterium sp. POL2]